MAVEILSKAQWSGGERSQTCRLIQKFKVGGCPGARWWKRTGTGLGRNPHPFRLRYHEGVLVGTKGQEAEREHGFYTEPPLSQLSNGKTLKL